MGEAALAWGGWRQGGVPFYLQLGDIRITNAAGLELADIPEARLIVAPDVLFGGGGPILVQSQRARFPGASVPVSLSAAIHLDHMRLARTDLYVTLGAGRLTDGPALTKGAFELRVTPQMVALTNGVLHLAPHGASTPVVTFTATAASGTDWTGTLNINVDTLQAPDLAAYWPDWLAHQARVWVVDNITAGIAHDASLHFGLLAPLTLSSLHLVSDSGGFAGQNITLGWLRDAPPITGLNGQFSLADLDTIVITGDSAQLNGVQLAAGRFTITGIAHHHQTGALSLNMSGRLHDALSVLNAAPLHLLREAPPGVAAATGDFTGSVTLELPFDKHMRFVDCPLHVAASVTGVTLASPLAGLDFTNGTLTLAAGNTGLSVDGTSLFAGEPATVSTKLDFTTRPARVWFSMAGGAGPIALHHFGLDESGTFMAAVRGVAPFTLALTPAAAAEAADLRVDLTPVNLALPHFAWAKPAGAPARLALKLLATPDGPLQIQSVFASGPGLLVLAQAHGPRLDISPLEIGATSATGALTPPQGSQDWIATFAGPRLTFILRPPSSASVTGASSPPAAAPAAEAKPAPPPPPGPLWQVSLNFPLATLAASPAPPLENFSFTGQGQGSTVRAATISASNPAMRLTITPSDGTRNISLAAADGGDLLRALGLYAGVQGGALSLVATSAAGTTSGTLTLNAFRLTHAPEFVKVLQALSIYGFGAATSGPGLGFEHLIAPFTLTPSLLTLKNARAYSPSLGFTASGTIALGSNTADLNTTVVPAYAVNALLGEMPVVGPLFTAEKGGGLIAIRVYISGPLSDPSVTLNPFSALTPGALRGVFNAPNESK
jgi:hypothetical protein